nr:retinol dehydrogenase 14-like [Onthophagus taurus]
MSFESIRKFAMEIDRNEEKIDVLINNAGVAGFGEYLTEDNLQITLQVNYFGPFLLTRLLMRSLKRSESARIINVASHMAKFAKIPKFQIDAYPNDLIDNFAKIRLYANSKLCMIYFTSALAKKLKGNNITVNALHPGGVQTDIFKRLPFQMFIKFITKTWFMTVEEGCRTSIYLATSNEVENVSGKMFDNCTEVDLEKYIKNWELEDIIWEQSEELVCLDRMEKNLIN